MCAIGRKILTKAKTLLFVILATLIFSSCSKIDKNNIPVTEKEFPDIIMDQADYTFGQPNKKPLLLHAQNIVMYTTQKRMEITDVAFKQKSNFQNEMDDIELIGSCDYAISRDNVTITMSGNVYIYKYSDNVEIFSDNLIWDDDNQEIRATGKVTVNYKNGTSITGTGFKALLDENVYEFLSIERGNFNNEE